ncbi:MAG: hypothetical protein AMXMBFR84_49930 [Candidatus Hydrogenedentota bacterium]
MVFNTFGKCLPGKANYLKGQIGDVGTPGLRVQRDPDCGRQLSRKFMEPECGKKADYGTRRPLRDEREVVVLRG